MKNHFFTALVYPNIFAALYSAASHRSYARVFFSSSKVPANTGSRFSISRIRSNPERYPGSWVTAIRVPCPARLACPPESFFAETERNGSASKADASSSCRKTVFPFHSGTSSFKFFISYHISWDSLSSRAELPVFRDELPLLVTL